MHRSDVDPCLSCSRYFGNALARSERGAIALAWADPHTLTIAAPAAGLTWEVRLAETPATRLLNGIAAALPDSLWRRPATLAAVGEAGYPRAGDGRG